MRWSLAHCIILAWVAITINDATRPKRDLHTIKNLLSTLFSGSYTKPLHTYNNMLTDDEVKNGVKIFRIPGFNRILIKAVPKDEKPEEVGPVKTNSTLTIVESYLQTKTREETLKTLEAIQDLLKSGILTARHDIVYPVPVPMPYESPKPISIIEKTVKPIYFLPEPPPRITYEVPPPPIIELPAPPTIDILPPPEIEISPPPKVEIPSPPKIDFIWPPIIGIPPPLKIPSPPKVEIPPPPKIDIPSPPIIEIPSSPKIPLPPNNIPQPPKIEIDIPEIKIPKVKPETTVIIPEPPKLPPISAVKIPVSLPTLSETPIHTKYSYQQVENGKVVSTYTANDNIDIFSEMPKSVPPPSHHIKNRVNGVIACTLIQPDLLCPLQPVSPGNLPVVLDVLGNSVRSFPTVELIKYLPSLNKLSYNQLYNADSTLSESPKANSFTIEESKNLTKVMPSPLFISNKFNNPGYVLKDPKLSKLILNNLPDEFKIDPRFAFVPPTNKEEEIVSPKNTFLSQQHFNKPINNQLLYNSDTGEKEHELAGDKDFAWPYISNRYNEKPYPYIDSKPFSYSYKNINKDGRVSSYYGSEPDNKKNYNSGATEPETIEPSLYPYIHSKVGNLKFPIDLSKPIPIKYTYKQISHGNPSKFTVVNIEDPIKAHEGLVNTLDFSDKNVFQEISNLALEKPDENLNSNVNYVYVPPLTTDDGEQHVYALDKNDHKISENTNPIPDVSDSTFSKNDGDKEINIHDGYLSNNPVIVASENEDEDIKRSANTKENSSRRGDIS